MTLRSTGFRISCDLDRCGRMQDIPARDEPEARDLADRLGWRNDGRRDICPADVAREQAAGRLGPKTAEPKN